MADAEDLKSSGDFSSCGFDSHPGHQFFFYMTVETDPSRQEPNRIFHKEPANVWTARFGAVVI
jgi:hypothetical protein